MPYQVTFDKLFPYDPGEAGITLQVKLNPQDQFPAIPAKVDTGASYCIFARRYGERLGLDIETGLRQVFGTATGTFVAYGYEVSLTVGELEFDTLAFFPADEEITRNVLGRFGWLDRVVLGLVDYEGKLYLSRY